MAAVVTAQALASAGAVATGTAAKTIQVMPFQGLAARTAAAANHAMPFHCLQQPNMLQAGKHV